MVVERGEPHRDWIAGTRLGKIQRSEDQQLGLTGHQRTAELQCCCYQRPDEKMSASARGLPWAESSYAPRKKRWRWQTDLACCAPDHFATYAHKHKQIPVRFLSVRHPLRVRSPVRCFKPSRARLVPHSSERFLLAHFRLCPKSNKLVRARSTAAGNPHQHHPSGHGRAIRDSRRTTQRS